MIIAIGGLAEADFVRAAGVRRIRWLSELSEVALCATSWAIVKLIGCGPAVAGTGSERGGGLRGGNAIELVVGEGLRAGGVEIVGNAKDVAGIATVDGIDKIVSEIHGVAAGGRGLDFLRLQAGVISLKDVQAIEARMVDGHAVNGPLGRVTNTVKRATGGSRILRSGVRRTVVDLDKTICGAD